MINKKGYSTGFAFVFGIVLIFGMGLMYVIFNQVFLDTIVPTAKNMVNGTTASFDILPATQTEINSNIDKYMSYWKIVPFILMFTVILYMVITAIRRKDEVSM